VVGALSTEGRELRDFRFVRFRDYPPLV